MLTVTQATSIHYTVRADGVRLGLLVDRTRDMSYNDWLFIDTEGFKLKGTEIGDNTISHTDRDVLLARVEDIYS